MGLLETLYLLLRIKKGRKGLGPIAVAIAAVALALTMAVASSPTITCCKYYDDKWSRRFQNYLKS